MNPQEDNIQLPPVDPVADTAQPIPQNQAVPASPQPANTPQQGQMSDDSQGPVVAGDIDLIEKEWVEKAKNIVTSTMGDPHAQSQKINQMKADYIKKRYNKSIRSEE